MRGVWNEIGVSTYCFTRGRVWYVYRQKRAAALARNKQTNKKMHAIALTSDRYIAVRSADGFLAYKGAVRILSKDGTIRPARWHASNRRLESCALNDTGTVLPMYSKSSAIESKLAALGINFVWLTLEQAQDLAS